MILYRPVGLQELELIYDSGMKAFPARLPQQPIFYPVLDLEYARQTASDWNARNGQLAGYVTQFKIEDDYISQFEKHIVGDSQHEEFWIPAEEVEEFNKHISGHIKVVEAYFGDGFQGFAPEQFGLQGKNGVAQFTLLTNSYLYKRMEFYLEIKRNHKAVFLNYPFWQVYDFKNPGLKKKVVQAIREAWLTSFPKIPLVPPLAEDVAPVKQMDAKPFVNALDEKVASGKEADSHAQHSVNVLRKNSGPAKPKVSPSQVTPVDEGTRPAEHNHSQAFVDSLDEESRSVEQTDSHAEPLVDALEENFTAVEPTLPYSLVNPVHANSAPVSQKITHFSQGIELGLNGKYYEAIEELSRAVAEDLDHIVAHTSLGVAFHRVGEDDRARACYDDALKIDPNYPEAHYFRANLLYSQGNVREAIAGYTIAIGLEPELIEAHRKPNPQDRLTDYSPAPAEMYWIAKPAHRILELNRLLASNPGQANLFKERAANYYRLWNYEQAITDHSSALAIQPDDGGTLHSRGLAYEQLGQFDRALDDYQQAIAVDPQLSDVYINRGVTFGKMGHFRQSIASLTEGIRLAPKNPDGYFNRGMSYFQQGNFESAIPDFSMTIQLSPKDEAAYYWRGISYEEAGHPREAIADYRQFLTLSQNPRAKEEIEHKLNQWNEGKRDGVSSRGAVPEDRQETDQSALQEPDQGLDLYDLIMALGKRALNSIWLGSGVDCYGERAEELYAFTDHNRPMQGRDLLRITSGIRQTMKGEFTAFDLDTTSHWIFIRAWDGNGFYIEINDPQGKALLKTHLQSAEEVEGPDPPYESLFIRT